MLVNDIIKTKLERKFNTNNKKIIIVQNIAIVVDFFSRKHRLSVGISITSSVVVVLITQGSDSVRDKLSMW